jgi:isopropylmalate/homocitrate/citramalate synthase
VWDKLTELGIDVNKEQLLEIVSIIKESAESRKSSITNAELKQIANEIK